MQPVNVTQCKKYNRHSELEYCSQRFNRPLPSSKNPHFQNEARCTTFLVKMSFIWIRMKNDFHIKGWAPTPVLKQRPGGTRKCLFISNLRGHPTGYPSNKYSSEQYQFKHWSKRTSGIASTHAHNHITPVVAVMDACRGRTALRFPTNSSHLYTVELALKEVLCSRLGSKGPVWERRALSLQRSDGFAMRMSCYVYFSA